MSELLSWDEAKLISPADAAKAELLAGAKRKNARRKVRETATFLTLRAAGKMCSNCMSFRVDSVGNYCNFHTDFYGTVRTTRDDLCLDWRPQ